MFCLAITDARDHCNQRTVHDVGVPVGVFADSKSVTDVMTQSLRNRNKNLYFTSIMELVPEKT